VLNSFSSPVIRYDIGDDASKSTKLCDCGLNLSILDKVEGRSSDIVLTPDGRVYHSIIFYYILKDLTQRIGQIKQFKVRQTDVNRLEFHIFKTNRASNEAENFIRKQVREKFGHCMNLEFFYHDQIEREKSGKLRDFETALDTGTLLPKMYAYSKKKL
jgi:phenylacetate-CoA ligase